MNAFVAVDRVGEPMAVPGAGLASRMSAFTEGLAGSRTAAGTRP
jgi:hypothetical protein